MYYLSFCLESKIRTCDLPRPRRVNNHRYLSSFGVHFHFFSGRQPDGEISMNLFCDSERIRTFNPGFRKPMLYPVELRNHLVISEGFEPSTFDVSGRCSNHLSHEILYFGYLRGSNPVLRFHRPALYQIS